MAEVFDCSNPTELLTGMRLARQAIGRGELVVIPTDTVYGVAANAFSPEAVQSLLDAKGRGRTSPPPVLIPDEASLGALAERVPEKVLDLVRAFWPGGLTVILPQRQTLDWDIGETRGTVALRVPKNPVALELLRETGPLAVSSANKTGAPAARTAAEAREMLGDSVAVYLDDGGAGTDYEQDPGRDSSTIVDAVRFSAGRGGLRIVRHGVIPDEAIRDVVGDALETDDA
jgi:tRNA threonylcarbamoyl adenosine modification protein (Sua5/YciO/YrdC/YwlC family)